MVAVRASTSILPSVSVGSAEWAQILEPLYMTWKVRTCFRCICGLFFIDRHLDVWLAKPERKICPSWSGRDSENIHLPLSPSALFFGSLFGMTRKVASLTLRMGECSLDSCYAFWPLDSAEFYWKLWRQEFLNAPNCLEARFSVEWISLPPSL